MIWLSDDAESQWVGRDGFNFSRVLCWNSLPPLGHFAWHWARQRTHARLLYCCALNFFFLLLNFVSGDLALTGFEFWTLNMNIQLPLVWNTWSHARGLDSATCAGLAHGQWLLRLYCLVAKVHEKSLPFFLLEWSKILKKIWPTLRGLRHTHPTLQCMCKVLVSFFLHFNSIVDIVILDSWEQLKITTNLFKFEW